MEITQCEAVLKAVESGSLSAAAEALNYTQSGITRMIRSLEQELGYEVFFRSKHGVSLTENGKAMLPLFQDIVRSHSNAKEFSSHLTGLLKGTLNIGTYYSISALSLPPVLKSYCTLYPGITINLTEGGNREIYQWLNDGLMDFCFCARPPEHVPCQWIHLFDDELMVWLPKDHPMADRASFPIRQLEQEPFIHTAPDHDTELDRLLRQYSLHPNTRYSTRDGFSAYKMVAAGLGISFNQRLIAQDWKKEITELSFDPPQYISLGIAVPLSRKLSPAAKVFVEHAEKELR